MEHYQVKFTDTLGNVYYGIVDGYSQEARDAKAEGYLLIEDAILPIRYKAKESNVTDIKLDFNPDNEYESYIQTELQKAQELSDSLPDGVHKGSLFSVGVADGAAYYVVTKVNKKTCTIEWRGFGGDRYYDHYFRSGGKFPIEDIARYVGFERGMKSIFGNSKKAA